MIALLASTVIVFYVLIPGSIYSFIFSSFVPIKVFQRTKIEEATFAASACLIPGALTIILFLALSWIRYSGELGCSIVPCRTDYQTFFAAAYSEKCFSCGSSDFWEGFRRFFWSQISILAVYYVFVAAKAYFYGRLSRDIYKLLEGPWRKWFAEHFLMPNVSEWYFLLTAALFPPKTRRVMVDIMTSEDRLYRGRVDSGTYYLDKDGELSGILLKEASRFDRRQYLRDQEAGLKPQSEKYWKSIPGSNWYIPQSKMLNLNIRYEPLPHPSADNLKDRIEQILKTLKISGRVTVGDPDPTAG